MAGKKITELNSGSLSNLPLSGVTAVVYSGTTLQHSLSDLRLKLVDSGSHHFTGSQHFNGDLTITGSIKSLIVGTGSFHINNPEILHVQNSGSYNIAHFEANNEYYAQVNIKNTNSGSNSSTDLVLTANNGTEGIHFVDLGINSSTYGGGLVGRENDAYLLNVGKDLYIGTVGGSEHPAKLFLFAENNWESPQITIHTGSQITFNTSSFTEGYTYEFSGSAKFVNSIETTTIIGSNELNLLTEGSNVNILGSNLVIPNGGINTSFNLTSVGANITQITNIDSVSEKLIPYNEPSTGITHNFLSGSVAYVSNPSSDFIIDVVEIPTTNNKAIGLTVIIEQDTPAYKITGLKINSDDEGPVSISWYGGSQPTGTTNSTDIFAFSLIKVNNTWRVLGQKTTF